MTTQPRSSPKSRAAESFYAGGESTGAGAFAAVESVLALHRELTGTLGEAFAEHAITLDQWRVLRVLAESGCNMGDLAKALAIPAPSLTRLVDSLATEALIYRRADPADRRVVLLYLSDLGRQRLAATDDAADAALGALRAQAGVAGCVAFPSEVPGLL